MLLSMTYVSLEFLTLSLKRIKIKNKDKDKCKQEVTFHIKDLKDWENYWLSIVP